MYAIILPFYHLMVKNTHFVKGAKNRITRTDLESWEVLNQFTFVH